MIIDFLPTDKYTVIDSPMSPIILYFYPKNKLNNKNNTKCQEQNVKIKNY